MPSTGLLEGLAPSPTTPIESAPPTAPVESAQPQTAADATTGAAALKEAFPSIPENVLKLPLFGWIATGKPPAVRFQPGAFYPELKPILSALPKLVKSGFDVYNSVQGDNVLFNPLVMPRAELSAIDKSGKLAQLIPDYGTLTGKLPTEMTDKDAQEVHQIGQDAHAGLVQEGFGAPPPAASNAQPPPQAPAPPPVKQAALSKVRVAALQPGAPTTGAYPGAGRAINTLAKPVI